ncbi:hypothetical protein X777_03659 [Ooceraea biroi]|uniref:Uncharacterized protein n=1 Tax=Ooceraea biroi TaxID=2015173 RepID=A0A026WLJ7_OOCBI|nr:hypothetical protein X777_03659 [Ooceraea biroi]
MDSSADSDLTSASIIRVQREIILSPSSLMIFPDFPAYLYIAHKQGIPPYILPRTTVHHRPSTKA